MPSDPKYLLRNLVMLRAMCPAVSERAFFIFGCQRSGTTLLLSILSSHPRITGIDESEFPSPYPFPSGYRLISNKLLDHYSCYKIIEHSNKLQFLKRYYPKSKILWIVRNPYSTILSMKNLVSNNKSWISRCAIKEIERLKPFFDGLKDINYTQLSEVEMAATYWYYKNQFPNILIKNGLNVFVLKYEKLLLNMSEQLKEIIDFLEVEWDSKVLEFYKHNESKVLAGGTRTDRPLNAARANAIEGLTLEEISQINLLCSSIMNQYGYIEKI